MSSSAVSPAVGALSHWRLRVALRPPPPRGEPLGLIPHQRGGRSGSASRPEGVGGSGVGRAQTFESRWLASTAPQGSGVLQVRGAETGAGEGRQGWAEKARRLALPSSGMDPERRPGRGRVANPG